MYNLIDKIKRYFTFNIEELKAIGIGSLVIGLMFALREWQNASFGDFISSVIVVLISLVFHLSVQKIAGLHAGFGVEFKVWWMGLMIGFVLTFITRGSIWWIVFPGGIVFTMLARHRLGMFRYGMNYWPMGIVAFAGPIASIIFGTIFKNINLYILGNSVPFFDKLFIFNLVLAACQMLPIPPLDGHYMFYASRSAYAFLLATIVIYVVLVLGLGVYSWIWALIIGAVLWLIYYIKFERVAW